MREPGVTNITVQDVCPAHRTEHYGFNYAPVAQGIVEDPLTGTAWRDHCTGTGPVRWSSTDEDQAPGEPPVRHVHDSA